MSVTCLLSGPLRSAVLEKQHLLHGSWALGPGEAVRQPETILAFTPHVGQPGPSLSERPLGLFFFKNVLALKENKTRTFHQVGKSEILLFSSQTRCGQVWPPVSPLRPLCVPFRDEKGSSPEVGVLKGRASEPERRLCSCTGDTGSTECAVSLRSQGWRRLPAARWVGAGTVWPRVAPPVPCQCNSTKVLTILLFSF